MKKSYGLKSCRLKSCRFYTNYSHQAFTLAEVLITLGIIGVVAAMTLPSLIQKQNDRATVAKVKKMYSLISNAVRYWQMENGCEANVADCLSSYNKYDCTNAFSGIEKQLPVVDKRYQAQPVKNIKWLPESSANLDGTISQFSWTGVSKAAENSDLSCHYLLNDGTTFMVWMPDSYKQSGLIFFDVNGVKNPNRVGKDIFPIGIGSYKASSKGVNPYYAEDENNDTYGQCRYNNGNECNADDGRSPTAYVLAHDKLPDLAKIFGK